MILRLALRNLYRHPRQTLTVGGLLTLSIALLFVGNAILDGTEAGIEESFIASFTAHLSLRARGEVDFSVFGDQTPVIGELFKMPTLAPYPEIRALLEQTPGVEAVTSLVSGLALLEHGNYRAVAPLFGVEADTYLKAMPGVTLAQGKFLARGERGVVLSEGRVRQMETVLGQKVALGSVVQFAVADGITFRIRSAPLVGIVRYPLRNETLDSIVLVDPTTLRELYNYLIASPSPGPGRTGGLGQGGEKGASLPSAAASARDPSVAKGGGARGPGAPDTVSELLGSLFEEPEPDTVAASQGVDREALEKELSAALNAPRPATDEGAWNFLLLRVSPQTRVSSLRRDLERTVRERGWEVEVLDWRQTAGTSALFLFWMRRIFNIGFLVVAITSLIILIDSLVMSVLERVPEIGTLRALGASPSVIRQLFLAETTLLSAAAGLLGVGLGIALSYYLKAHPFQLRNDFLVQLFGGSALLPRLSVNRALLSWLASVLLGLVGWIYPVRIALRVQPRAAMERRL